MNETYLVKILAELGHKTRLSIYKLIMKYGSSGIIIGESTIPIIVRIIENMNIIFFNFTFGFPFESWGNVYFKRMAGNISKIASNCIPNW